MDTALGGFLFAQQIYRITTHDGQIFGRGIFAYQALTLVDGDIQYPMDQIFDPQCSQTACKRRFV